MLRRDMIHTKRCLFVQYVRIYVHTYVRSVLQVRKYPWYHIMRVRTSYYCTDVLILMCMIIVHVNHPSTEPGISNTTGIRTWKPTSLTVPETALVVLTINTCTGTAL